jgi:hypothetical protein
MKKLTLLTLLTFAFSISISAQSDLGTADLGTADLKTESISIFKNGSAFYVKSGKVKTENSVYRMTENFPKALFGTYWFGSSVLKSVKSFQDTVKQNLNANSITEMLVANEGKQVMLQVAGNPSDASLSGKLVSVTKLDNIASGSVQSRTILMETSNGWISLKSEQVRSISFNEKPNLQFTSKKVQPIIELGFSNSQAQQSLSMMYLQNGLGWLPNYLINMTADDKAELTLRAEVTNDAEDIVNTSVNFVVGVPNFKYAKKLASLVDFLGTAGRRSGGTSNNFNNFSNSLSTQRVSYGGDDAWGSGGFGDFEEEETESGVGIAAVEDLFYYTISGISLKKGGRAYYDILKTKVDIEHIYESNISSNGTGTNAYRKTYSFTEDKSNTVFHSIKLKNEAKSPWTTGSAMVVRTDKGIVKPISQDLLSYTPVSGTSFVKLTEAHDVKVKHAEKEMSREAKSIKWRNYSYDLIQVEGQVKIKNYKQKAIQLNVKRYINGEFKKSSQKWETEERVNLSGSVNKSTQVCWEMDLKAGEEKVITYSYQVYVR